jgi:hypothetical protein
VTLGRGGSAARCSAFCGALWPTLLFLPFQLAPNLADDAVFAI